MKNRDAERTIIGWSLTTKKLPNLKSSDFGDHTCREVFDAMVAAHNNGTGIELPAVSSKCSLDISALMDMMDGVPSNINVKTYVDIIKDLSSKRKIDSIFNTYNREKIADPNVSAEDILGEIGNILSEVGDLKTAPTNIAGMVEALVDATNGDISTTFCYNELQLATPKQKRAASKALQRMKADGKLESNGKAGHYRKVDHTLTKIGLFEDEGDPLDIILPMGLNRFFECFPKNIIVVAGEPDAGKTAFMLNILRANIFKAQKVFGKKIKYFSSEMGGSEFTRRLKAMGRQDENPLTEKEWKDNFTAFDRDRNFSDVLDPEGLNIIDFLEIHDNFWEVSARFQEIHNKLTTGVAIVAIQKNRGNQHGRGGSFGAEKARLYINLNRSLTEDHEIEIAKCKNRPEQQRENPNGLACRFRLIDGCFFQATSSWTRERIDEQSNPNGQNRQGHRG